MNISRRWRLGWTFTAILVLLAGCSSASRSEHGPESGARVREEMAVSEDLADKAAGTYRGAIVSNRKDATRSDTTVTVTRLERDRVRVSSSNSRLGSVEVRLKRKEKQIVHDGGDTPFALDLDSNPPMLLYSPHQKAAFSGRKL